MSATYPPTEVDPVAEADLAAHEADTTDAHGAGAISYDPTASGLAADDVQAAIDEVFGDLVLPDGVSLEVVNGKLQVKDVDSATNGQVLTSDGAGGTTFSTPQGIPLQPGYVSGQYYSAFIGSFQGAGTGAPTLNQALFSIFPVYEQTTFDRIATYITANGSTGAVDRLGIFADNGGKPGTLLLDAGTVATDTGASGIRPITINLALSPGIYWAASVPQVASATHQRFVPVSWGGYLSTAFNGNVLNATGVTGSFSSNPTLGATAGAINPPTIALRAA